MTNGPCGAVSVFRFWCLFEDGRVVRPLGGGALWAGGKSSQERDIALAKTIAAQWRE